MFTGLIEAVKPVNAVRDQRGGLRITVDIGSLSEGTRLGDSIAVDGVCLTVSAMRGTTVELDVMAETLRVSTLKMLKPGRVVNLERALALGDRLGGHLVQGHVDDVGVVAAIDKTPEHHVLWVRAQPSLMGYVIPKGSVAINGVSLTVVGVEADRFSVWLIPTTLDETNLAELAVGSPVNLEADLMGKWIRHRLDQLLLGDSAGSGSLAGGGASGGGTGGTSGGSGTGGIGGAGTSSPSGASITMESLRQKGFL